MSLLLASARALPLAAETVQCVVTSPPYWGLRQYEGEQREVWGGDPGHAHEWGEVAPHDRVYHWIEHDPELRAKSHQSCLMGPDGRFWHFWCAPEEAGWPPASIEAEDDEPESEDQP